jgi:hypothetical protein
MRNRGQENPREKRKMQVSAFRSALPQTNTIRKRSANRTLDGRVLGLAHAPHVAGLDRVLKDDGAARHVLDTNGARGRHLEGLVVRAVLLSLLRHQADVGSRAHRLHVELPVGRAVLHHLVIDARVRAVGDEAHDVLQLVGGVPHLARVAHHARHRRVNDNVGRRVQIGDALRRVNHREAGARRVHCVNVGEDLGLLARVQLLDLEQHVAETIGRVDADRLERVAVLGKQVLEKDGHGVAKKDLRRQWWREKSRREKMVSASAHPLGTHKGGIQEGISSMVSVSARASIPGPRSSSWSP